MSEQHQTPANSVLAALTGRRLPGGCDDCSAYQTVSLSSDGLYVLADHHDQTCPFYAGVT